MLAELAKFNVNPTPENMSYLLGIPVIYNVLQYEIERGKSFSPTLLGVFLWIEFRADAVFKKLVVHEVPGIDPSAEGSDGGWKAVS